ncbi:hypothetical protein NXZ84_10450 [Mechercharimyces sp. CAU 1602]|nr:hypothetical protein [Mechercharimyces sp. CAU 1602]
MIDMNRQAAIFACRFTGGIGILFSLLIGTTYGLSSTAIGILLSMLWFVLAHFISRDRG